MRADAPDDMTALHGSPHGVNGMRFAGLGYDISPAHFDSCCCNMSETDARAVLKTCSESDILISHYPPNGIADGRTAGNSRQLPFFANYPFLHEKTDIQ